MASATFDPGIAGVGNHTLSLVYLNPNGCHSIDQRIISVHGLPAVNGGADIQACTNGNTITLSGGTPIGGSWSGAGVSGDTFEPAIVNGVAGAYYVTYTYQDTYGCEASDQKEIILVDPIVIDIGTDRTFCTAESAYNLNIDLAVADLGGTWSGQGVSGNNFSPGLLNAGAYTITYENTDVNGCATSQFKFFTVAEGPDIDAGETIEACLEEGIVALYGATPSGGVWSGIGVDNLTSTVDLSVTSTGIHTLTYFYSGATCDVSDERTLIVNAPTNVSAGNNLTVCENDNDFLITGASLNGGVWTGSGVSGDYFSPSSVAPNTYTLTYTYTNSKNCVSSDTRDITVNAVPAVTAGADIILCSNSGIYVLHDDVNPNNSL